jgi:Recombination endonuclease VII
VVIREVERAQDKIRNRRFLCRCAKCGEEKVKYLSNLEQGKGCMCSLDWQVLSRAGRDANVAARHTAAMVSELGRICLTCGTWKPWEEFKSCGANRTRYMGKDSNCKACNAERRIARMYGLTRDELLWLYQFQDHLCALCGKDGTFYQGECLNIDHDHSCCGPTRACKKCIRGLLCSHCNRFLVAYVEQRPLLATRFADYLAMRPFLSVIAAGDAEPVLEDVRPLAAEKVA